MTDEQRKITAAKLYVDLEKLITNLYDRWYDEKDYEDINDYAEPIKTEVEKIGGQFLKMSKKPFGFTYQLADATYQLTMNTQQYTYKRIK